MWVYNIKQKWLVRLHLKQKIVWLVVKWREGDETTAVFYAGTGEIFFSTPHIICTFVKTSIDCTTVTKIDDLVSDYISRGLLAENLRTEVEDFMKAYRPTMGLEIDANTVRWLWAPANLFLYRKIQQNKNISKVSIVYIITQAMFVFVGLISIWPLRSNNWSTI